MVKSVICSIFVLFFSIQTAMSIKCYQCTGTDSEHPFQCNEWLSDYDIEPQSCDEVFGAKYCIKHIGRFEGIFATSLKCYQCTSASSIYCSDGLVHSDGIEPESCDNVFEAQYCIKELTLSGGIGAKRYCSSLDLGNYCNYVQQPGDKLEYRTCVNTCTGDGCNSATGLFISKISLLLGLGSVFLRTLLY